MQCVLMLSHCPANFNRNVVTEIKLRLELVYEPAHPLKVKVK